MEAGDPCGGGREWGRVPHLPSSMDEGGETQHIASSPLEGLGRRKEKKERVFMERMSKASFLFLSADS